MGGTASLGIVGIDGIGGRAVGRVGNPGIAGGAVCSRWRAAELKVVLMKSSAMEKTMTELVQDAISCQRTRGECNVCKILLLQ